MELGLHPTISIRSGGLDFQMVSIGAIIETLNYLLERFIFLGLDRFDHGFFCSDMASWDCRELSILETI